MTLYDVIHRFYTATLTPMPFVEIDNTTDTSDFADLVSAEQALSH